MIDHRQFGRLLTAARKTRGLSLENAAQSAKMSTTYYCNLEQGTTSTSLARLAMLRRVLGLDVNPLLRALPVEVGPVAIHAHEASVSHRRKFGTFEALGRNFVRARSHEGLSLASLASAVGVSPSHITRVESGRRAPSLALFAKLQCVLNFDANVFLDSLLELCWSGMYGYVGQTRASNLIAKLKSIGIGECTQPYEYPPRRGPWICDNGAWKMREWPGEDVLDHWRSDARREFYRRVAQAEAIRLPTIVILPDIVAGGQNSLTLSLAWLEWMTEHTPILAERAYLAVQNGMSEKDVKPHLPRLSGLFVGGSTEWKWQTAQDWSNIAHNAGRQLHIGRVGTLRLVRLARNVGADSIDSSLPLRSKKNLHRWLRALDEPDLCSDRTQAQKRELSSTSPVSRTGR